jgi:hypothetical protein
MTDPHVTHRVVNERGEPTWRTGSPPASSTQTTQHVEATAAPPVEYDMFTGALSGRESIAPTLKQTLVYFNVAHAAAGADPGRRRMIRYGYRP